MSCQPTLGKPLVWWVDFHFLWRVGYLSLATHFGEQIEITIFGPFLHISAAHHLSPQQFGAKKVMMGYRPKTTTSAISLGLTMDATSGFFLAQQERFHRSERVSIHLCQPSMSAMVPVLFALLPCLGVDQLPLDQVRQRPRIHPQNLFKTMGVPHFSRFFSVFSMFFPQKSSH